MALNILEVIDVTEGGDKVDEGFVKCLNNWQALSAELLPGYMRRSQFGYVAGGTTLTVGGGIYEVNGTLARITSELTTAAHGLAADPAFIYLYIDHSEIPATGIIDNTDLLWSLTSPTWSHSKLGFYFGDDRCIFSTYAASDLFLSFIHTGNFVQYASGKVSSIDGTVAQLTTTMEAVALAVPDFGKVEAQISSASFYVDADAFLECLPADLSGSTEMQLGYVDSTVAGDVTVANVITDESQQIKVKESATSANTYRIRTNGYWLPEGI
jgi:hypothetical protein